MSACKAKMSTHCSHLGKSNQKFICLAVCFAIVQESKRLFINSDQQTANQTKMAAHEKKRSHEKQEDNLVFSLDAHRKSTINKWNNF